MNCEVRLDDGATFMCLIAVISSLVPGLGELKRGLKLITIQSTLSKEL